MANFSQPGISNPEDKFVAADHAGALLLFFPTNFMASIKTSNGETDAVDARVVNLNTGRVLENARIFGSALVPQLKGAIPDGMVLGILGQGENRKGNPPWLLFPHTQEHVNVAEAWLAANPRQAQPAPPTPPAYGQQASGGWGQQAAPSAPATGGWGQQPSASPAPQTGGWGSPAPAAPVQSQFPEGTWGNAVPAAPPQIDPGLVAALQSRGVNPAQLTSQAQAEQIAASLGLTRQ